jgi:hypothetical protein
MIWSASRNFCFIHIAKTGGTSIAAAYEPHMLFNDIILGGTVMGERLQEPYRRRFALHKHSGARAIIQAAGAEAFARAYSFAVLRDPVDRMVSLYRWLRGGPAGEHPLRAPALANGLEAFAAIARQSVPSQAAQVKVNGIVAVTRLYRFDELAESWAAVAAMLGIDAPIPHSNRSKGEQVEVSPAARALIEASYAEDLALYRALPRLSAGG